MHTRLRPPTSALIVVIAALLLVPTTALASDKKPKPVPPPPPPPPTITLTTSGTSFVAPAVITLNAIVTPNDGRIESVRFRNGARRVGTIDRNAPYSIVWRKAKPGVYTLTAVGKGKKGLQIQSAPIVITITAPPPPPPPPPPPNVAPSVSITADLTTFTTAQTMTLTATATDSDGTVARVDFYPGRDPAFEQHRAGAHRHLQQRDAGDVHVHRRGDRQSRQGQRGLERGDGHRECRATGRPAFRSW